MHRSGTSALARAVNLLGAYIGEETDLVPKSRFNPEGYWEQQAIVDLHDKILDHFNRDWRTAAPLPEGWHLMNEMKPFRTELIDLIRAKYKDQKLWMWKDPRTSILLEIWKNALKELGIHLSCIVIIRNPLEVVGSLEKRTDPSSRNKIYGIWLNYNLCILRSTKFVQHALISFDDFMMDCENQMRRCSAALDLPWPEGEEIRTQIKQFIRPDLRHNITGIDELRRSDAPSSVITFWELLQNVIRRNANADDLLNLETERLYSELNSYARFFNDESLKCYKYHKSLEALKLKMDACRNELAEKNERIKFLEQQLSTPHWKRVLEKCRIRIALK